MNFLLDTHVWLWSLIEPGELKSTTHSALANRQNTLFLSPISIWETLLLIERQRVLVSPTPELWLNTVLANPRIQEAPLTYAIARRCRQVQLPHQDPADRFIAATALEYSLTLMTADHHLLQSAELTTWSAI